MNEPKQCEEMSEKELKALRRLQWRNHMMYNIKHPFARGCTPAQRFAEWMLRSAAEGTEVELTRSDAEGFRLCEKLSDGTERGHTWKHGTGFYILIVEGILNFFGGSLSAKPHDEPFAYPLWTEFEVPIGTTQRLLITAGFGSLWDWRVEVGVVKNRWRWKMMSTDLNRELYIRRA